MLRGLFSSSTTTPERTREAQPKVPDGGELRKDPVCGTYVSIMAGVQGKVKGETVYASLYGIPLNRALIRLGKLFAFACFDGSRGDKVLRSRAALSFSARTGPRCEESHDRNRVARDQIMQSSPLQF